MATQGEILTELRSRLDDEDELSWTDPELRRWINEGLFNVARDTECLLETSDVAAIVGTDVYNFPTDMIRFHMIRWLDANDNDRGILRYLDQNQFDNRGPDPSGTPMLFTSWGFPSATASTMSFKTYPAPNETGTLRVYYYKRPAALATTDNSDANTDVGLPTGWEDIVTAYAEFRALRKGRDPRWQEAAAEYNTQLERFKMIAIRWTDQAGQMGPSQMWGVPEWLVFDDGGGWW